MGQGLDVKLGQFNSLIGYEVIESPLNANYSHSWLFGLEAEPLLPFSGRPTEADWT
ncbi:MAG: outer membrane beta-barrel protein [Nitrospira sp.]|nr:outer membrane beta-barrel protein [Nitrospira sp.]